MIDGKLIGLHITITDAKNRTNIGKEGKIVNETKKTITIRTGEKDKILFKGQIAYTEKK